MVIKMKRSLELELVTPLLIVLLLVGFIGGVAFSPGIYFYLAIMGVAVLAITVLAIRKIVLFKVGARNILRRKGLSAIVIGGLMVGTVIISSSLVVGDTMDEMIVSTTYDMFHETDEVIYYLESDGSFGPIDDGVYLDIREGVMEIENVANVIGELLEYVQVNDLTSGQAEGEMLLVGFDPDIEEFGRYERHGLDMNMDLGPDEVYLDKKAARDLDAGKGDDLRITTLYGPFNFRVKGIIDSSGRAGIASDGAIHMELDTARSILGMEGIVNHIRISNDGGVRSGQVHCDDVVRSTEPILEMTGIHGLEVQMNKEKEIEDGKEEIKEFSNMFLIFGSFSIIAGVILIINIFVMLGEERKGEMGISRAVGMKRKHLRESFMFEGSIYALVSSVIGSMAGVGIAFLVLAFLDMIIKDGFGDTSLLSSFNFTAGSIVTSIVFGFLITLITVSLTSMRISRLNIIRAIRSIPEPKLSTRSLKGLIIGGSVTICGLMLFLGGLLVLPDSGIEKFQEATVYLGISTGLLGLGFVLRRFVGDRIAFSTVTATLILLWLIPSTVLFPGMVEGDLEMFFLSGIFIVSSAVILFVYNSHSILGLIAKFWGAMGRPTATMKTASSYPMKNKFRTGMTIYMFALVVFTITVMSMLVGVLSFNIERISQEQLGDIDLVGSTGPNSRIDDIEHALEFNSSIGMEPFDAVYDLSYGYTEIHTDLPDPEGEGDYFLPWPVIGFDEDFSDCGWSFSSRLERFESDREVWEAVHSEHDLIILDGTFLGEEGMMGDEFGGLSYDPGDTISFVMYDGRTVSKTVAGILDQFILSGLFISKKTMVEELNVSGTGAYVFTLKDGQNPDSIAKAVERDLGINMIVLENEMKAITSMMERFFDLFMAYMGLGLIVGIAGLGIITLRAVHERRQEIGMMRAIGFRKGGVMNSFLMEASFICIVGIVIGTVLGMIVGYNIWYEEFKPLDYEFYIPWLKILAIGAIAFVTTAAFTIPPSMKASTVTPAEALRYE